MVTELTLGEKQGQRCESIVRLIEIAANDISTVGLVYPVLRLNAHSVSRASPAFKHSISDLDCQNYVDHRL